MLANFLKIDLQLQEAVAFQYKNNKLGLSSSGTGLRKQSDTLQSTRPGQERMAGTAHRLQRKQQSLRAENSSPRTAFSQQVQPACSHLLGTFSVSRVKNPRGENWQWYFLPNLIKTHSSKPEKYGNIQIVTGMMLVR